MTDSPNARRRVVVAAPRRVELHAIRVIVEPDPNPDISYLDQRDFAERKAEYRRNGFSFVGVRIEAELTIAGTPQTLTSPGLWGVESDTVAQIADGEWTCLRGVLKTVGVSTEQLPLEVEREWIEWRT